MAARAFSAYVEDQLAEQNTSSEFLSFGSEGRFVLPIPEFPHPFPQGDERKAINEAFDTFFKTVRTREGEDGNVALFQRRTRDSVTIPVAGKKADLDAIIKVTRRAWRGAPEIVAVDGFADLPPTQQKKARKEGSDGSDIVAAWHDGKAWLVRSHPALATRQGIEEALFHEVWGHYGLRMVFGKDTMRALTRMATAMGGIPGILRYAKKYDIDLSTYVKGFRGNDALSRGERQAMLLDELAAHIAQHGTDHEAAPARVPGRAQGVAAGSWVPRPFTHERP